MWRASAGDSPLSRGGVGGMAGGPASSAVAHGARQPGIVEIDGGANRHLAHGDVELRDGGDGHGGGGRISVHVRRLLVYTIRRFGAQADAVHTSGVGDFRRANAEHPLYLARTEFRQVGFVIDETQSGDSTCDPGGSERGARMNKKPTLRVFRDLFVRDAGDVNVAPFTARFALSGSVVRAEVVLLVNVVLK